MSVAMSDTFLTEPLAMDFPEPEAMIRVREEHSRLQGVVFSLNKKISQVLAKQEGDFLAAYRAHMYTVQKELQTLRQRVIEAENVLQKNDKVQKLEDECDWYRKEALRLDSFNTAMKKDLKYIKGKLEILEDDRNWLARQLKACKKQDKVLRAELGLRGESVQDYSQIASTDNPSGRCLSNIDKVPSQPLLSGVMGSLDRVRRHQQSASSPGFLPFNQEERHNSRSTPDQRGKSRSPEDALAKRVRTLERRLVKEKRETMRVRATRARHAIERAEMEDFFMQCIEDVKRKIEQRKIRQRSNRCVLVREKESAGAGRALSPTPETEPSKITLQQFTASDRRAVVESLLQREDVITHLFDMFFPVVSSARGANPTTSKEQCE